MKSIVLALVAVFLVGCAAQRLHEEGLRLIHEGQYEAGLARIHEASKADPSDRRYRMDAIVQRDLSTQKLVQLAEFEQGRQNFTEAKRLLDRAASIDPGNKRIDATRAALDASIRTNALLVDAEEHLKATRIADAFQVIKRILAENPGHRKAQGLLRQIEEKYSRGVGTPRLGSLFRQPVTIELRDATVRQVFDILAQATDISFLFDKDLRTDSRTTVIVRNQPVEQVLRYVLTSNQIAHRVLNESTILVYPSTPAKLREYQELVTRTFYLTNANAKDTGAMIRALVKTKDVFVDEKLSMVVMRDTPEAVRMAERLVANHDLADPEVMLDVEILEVGSNTLTELGIRYPSQISYSVAGAAGADSLTLAEWNNRNAGLVRMSIGNPALIINLRSQSGNSNLLASPKIRVKSRDKAKIHIGDKVPVLTTTSTATGFVSESVSYVDVGLKLDVEPQVALDDDVSIKIGLEVSNIVQEVRSASGSLTYRIGTRNAATNLRLKDGETQILAGLISDEDRRSSIKVPGLGDIPIVGRIFGTNSTNGSKTEVVLLITPRILRNLNRPDARLEAFASGTEASIGSLESPIEAGSAAVAAQDASPGPNAPAAGTSPMGRSATSPSTRPSVLLGVPAQAPIGSEMIVPVTIANAGRSNGVIADLTFDPARLSVIGVEPGNLFDGASEKGELRSQVAAQFGRVRLAHSGAALSRESGILANIRFRVLGGVSGTTLVRIEKAHLVGQQGQQLELQPLPAQSITLTGSGK